MAFLARALRRDVREGDPVGRIRIKRIGVSYVVVEGTDPATLRKGPGHYTQTPLPGLSGTVAIAGHRTTYVAPFRKLNQLRRGDRITVEMPYGRFTYAVQRTKIVSPKALWVIRRQTYDRLVLTACHPLYSAAQRIVVFARLVGFDAARRRGAWAPEPDGRQPHPRSSPSPGSSSNAQGSDRGARYLGRRSPHRRGGPERQAPGPRQAHRRMDDDMSMPRLETLKARIRNDDYAVDTHAVAEAILSRLLAAGRPRRRGRRSPLRLRHPGLPGHLTRRSSGEVLVSRQGPLARRCRPHRTTLARFAVLGLADPRERRSSAGRRRRRPRAARAARRPAARSPRRRSPRTRPGPGRAARRRRRRRRRAAGARGRGATGAPLRRPRCAASVARPSERSIIALAPAAASARPAASRGSGRRYRCASRAGPFGAPVQDREAGAGSRPASPSRRRGRPDAPRRGRRDRRASSAQPTTVTETTSTGPRAHVAAGDRRAAGRGQRPRPPRPAAARRPCRCRAEATSAR